MYIYIFKIGTDEILLCRNSSLDVNEGKIRIQFWFIPKWLSKSSHRVLRIAIVGFQRDVSFFFKRLPQ